MSDDANVLIWRELQAAYATRETVSGTVIEASPGGRTVGVGVRALLPASLIEPDPARIGPLERYVGQRVGCKIIELHVGRLNIVLSRRAALESNG